MSLKLIPVSQKQLKLFEVLGGKLLIQRTPNHPVEMAIPSGFEIDYRTDKLLVGINKKQWETLSDEDKKTLHNTHTHHDKHLGLHPSRDNCMIAISLRFQLIPLTHDEARFHTLLGSTYFVRLDTKIELFKLKQKLPVYNLRTDKIIIVAYGEDMDLLNREELSHLLALCDGFNLRRDHDSPPNNCFALVLAYEPT